MEECKVLNGANGKESELHKQFENIFNDKQAAEIAYAKILGESFKKRFGDWEFNYKNPSDEDVYFYKNGVTIEEAVEVKKISREEIRKEISDFRKLGETKLDGEPLLTHDLKNNMWFFTDKNGDRDYIDKYKFSDFTAQEVEEVTNHFIYRFVLQSGKKSLNNYDPSELEKGRIMSSIDMSIEAYKKSIIGKKNYDVLLKRIKLVEANKEDFRTEFISAIASLGFSIREKITDDEGNVITEVSEKDKGGGVNIQESFETNTKDTATVNTKIMLSQIKEKVWADVKEEDGTIQEKAVDVPSGFLETPSFAKFDDVWNTLNKLLVDEVGYGHGENVVDIFTVMYNKIDEFRDTKLWLSDLKTQLDKMIADNDTNKITEFVQAFNKTQINYYVTQTDRGEYTVINATSTNSRQSQITNTWNNAFKSRFLSESGILEERERVILKEILDDTRTAFSNWTKGKMLAGDNRDSEAYKDAIYDSAGEATADIIDLMNRLGVTDLDRDDVQNMIIMNGGDKKIDQTIDNIYKALGFMLSEKNGVLNENFSFVNESGAFENIFNRESFTKAFAEAVGIRMTDMADMSVLLNQGKSGYTITNPTYISNKINEWKKRPEELDELLKDMSKKNSRWIRHLLAKDKKEGKERNKAREERLQDFKAGLDASFKSRGKNDGKDNTSITTNDQINANLVQMLNEKIGGKSFFPTIIAADKSRRMLFQGLPKFDSKIVTKRGTEEAYISETSVDVGYGYFLDEYQRMRRVNRENKDDGVKKAVHYHGEEGNGVKSQIFPEFNKDNDDPAYADLRAAIYGKTFESDQFPDLSSEQIDIIKKHIRQSIFDRVTEHAEELSNLDGKSKSLLAAYGNDMNALAGDYFMNGLISSVEYTKLFSGDPAYYKNNADLIKRIPATYTDGLQLRLKDKNSLIFNQATVKGVEVASQYVDKILESVKDKSIALAYGRTVDKDGKSIGNNVNTTDAQAWITPRRWRFLKQGLGQWGPQHDKVYGKMISGEAMSPQESKLAAQPLKGVYFEINQGRPVYLKYSQAVLIPSLVKGTPMEALYNKMTKDPKTGKEYSDGEAHLEVHEVITIDGVKVGAIEPTRINKEGTTEMLSEADIELKPQKLNNRGWKLQQDLPIKLMKETNVGSQIQKNIFEGLQMEGQYAFEGGMSGSDLARRIHKTVSKLSDLGKDEINKEFDIDENGKITDKQYVYDALIREFKDRGGNENIIDALKKQMPLDAIPQIKGKAESIFMSIINRAMTKITTEGGSFIQVSPFGLENLGEGSGIIPLDKTFAKEGGLLPPRIEDGKVLPGQAMIPHSQAVKLLKKHGINLAGKNMKSAMALLDPSALELITYRIPNQGMSSNDYLQIVGILPPGVGDSIVVYDGLPAKTGSDFDIDKLFAMQNNVVYDTETGSISKLTEENKHLAVKTLGRRSYTNKETGERVAATPDVMYSEAEIEKMLAQNELVAQYKAVLNSPLTYDAMMRSIDGAQLKDDIVGTKKKNFKDGLFPAPVMKNMELFSPLTQLKTKSEYLSGKMGVGQTANHLVDHVMNQMLNVRFPEWIGVGNKDIENGQPITFFDRDTTDKYSIADNLSAFLNAYVDIAKDPYIARANHNSITANTTFMLLRAGATMEWVNRFIGQPILKELVALEQEQMSITAEDITVKNKKGSIVKGNALDKIREKYGFPSIPDNVSGSTVAGLYKSALQSNIIGEERSRALDYEVLKAWSFLKEKGKIFGEAVIAAKSDTAGNGGSNVSRLVNENKIEMIINRSGQYPDLKREKNILGYEAKFNGSMLATYASNTLDYTRKIVQSSDLFLSGTKAARDTFNRISFETGNGQLLVNERLGKTIDAAFYSYIMSGTSLFKDNFKNYKKITEQTPENVFNAQQEIIEGTRERNFLLEELQIESRESDGKEKKFLGINNKNKPTYYQNQIYRSWMKLHDTYYKNEDGSNNLKETHPDRKLAIDLVKYAFTGSGFQNNLTQFFTHIPHQILKDNDISGEIRDSIRNSNEIASDSYFPDQFQRHSKDNPKVIKTLKVDSMEGNADVFIYNPSKNKTKGFGSVGADNQTFFPKFAKGMISYRESYLYERIGTVLRKDVRGRKIKSPVYARTFELGSTEGKYKTFEYSKGENVSFSNIEKNNLKPSVLLAVEDAKKKIMLESSFKDNRGFDLDSIISNDSAKNAERLTDLEVVQSNLAQIIEDNKIQCK